MQNLKNEARNKFRKMKHNAKFDEKLNVNKFRKMKYNANFKK